MENVGPVARLGVVVETIAQEGVRNNHVLWDGQQTATSMLYEMSSTWWASQMPWLGLLTTVELHACTPTGLVQREQRDCRLGFKRPESQVRPVLLAKPQSTHGLSDT